MNTLAAAFSKKVSIVDESSSFSFSFDLTDPRDQDDDDSSKSKAAALKKKMKNKNKKKKKKAKQLLTDPSITNGHSDVVITESQSQCESPPAAPSFPSPPTPTNRDMNSVVSLDQSNSNSSQVYANTTALPSATVTAAASGGGGGVSVQASHSHSSQSKHKDSSSPPGATGLHVISCRDPELTEEQRKLRRFGKGLNVSIIGPKKKVVADWTRVPPGFGAMDRYGCGCVVVRTCAACCCFPALHSTALYTL